MTSTEQVYKWRKSHALRAKESEQAWRHNNPVNVKRIGFRYYDGNTVRLREESHKKVAEHLDYYRRKYKEWVKRHKAQMKVVNLSNYLLRKGEIIKTPCVNCGSEDRLKMFHLDYEDPYHIVFKCHNCFWEDTKQRNRQKKLARLRTHNAP